MYSGGWLRQATQPKTVPLVAPTDPQHLVPDANPEFSGGMAATWKNNAAAPNLPDALMPLPTPELGTGIGPVDRTPESHGYGVGIGAGLTRQESQDRMGPWHEEDHGAVAAHDWVPYRMRDGSPHSAILYDTPGDGDSPQTLQLQRTGVGQPNDPGARVGQRISRWYKRYIDRHSWDVQLRPYANKYAATTQSQPAVTDGTQINSPFPTAPGMWGGTPDRFVVPTVRRTPGPWDDTMATDGTVGTVTGSLDNYGLTSW